MEDYKLKDDEDLSFVSHDVDDQEWLMSFVDLITLLMACFFILYTLKSANVSKQEKISQSIHEAVAAVVPSTNQIERLDYSSLYKNISDYIQTLNLETHATIKLTKVGVEISTDGSMLFDPGSAELNNNSKDIISKIATSLMHEPFFIQIEGHTDSTPITTVQYPTNWELSAARAARVARLLISLGIEPSHLSAIGYADTRLLYPDQPLHPNNRRVIFVISKL